LSPMKLEKSARRAMFGIAGAGGSGYCNGDL
jgi:hypothetical protein